MHFSTPLTHTITYTALTVGKHSHGKCTELHCFWHIPYKWIYYEDFIRLLTTSKRSNRIHCCCAAKPRHHTTHFKFHFFHLKTPIADGNNQFPLFSYLQDFSVSQSVYKISIHRINWKSNSVNQQQHSPVFFQFGNQISSCDSSYSINAFVDFNFFCSRRITSNPIQFICFCAFSILLFNRARA